MQTNRAVCNNVAVTPETGVVKLLCRVIQKSLNPRASSTCLAWRKHQPFLRL